MGLLERLHGGYVYGRRVRVLSGWLAALIPPDTRVLDVGCGDGLLSHRVAQLRPDVEVRGLDVLLRPQTHIPVTMFDGETIPHGDATFDVVMFVDMLHHTGDPLVLLREAARVARRAIVIKDHTRDGFLAGPTLRFMDWMGNARHGVTLPYNYGPAARWAAAFDALGLEVTAREDRLGLYPWPASMCFDRGLHFAARLERRA